MRKTQDVFIIAEAGSNWKARAKAADLRRAKAMVDAAKSAGADAIKFQTFRTETVYVPNAGQSDYLSQHGMRQSINDIFKKIEMPYKFIPQLATYCRKAKIHFMSSVFSEEDFRRVDPYVSIHKIASYEISHPHLICLAARSRKPLILSTGAASLSDIDWAVNHFKKNGGKDLILMQCTAKYPAPLAAMNLRTILGLRRRYKVSVGLSDHSRDPIIAPVTAVTLGAEFIEKHFTLNRHFSGPDHAFAVTPSEFKTMVQAVRDCKKTLGNGKKTILIEERELRSYAQRAIQATRNIKKGDIFKEGKNFEILRPGKQVQGLHPRFLSIIEGKKAKRAIPLGHGISRSDIFATREP